MSKKHGARFNLLLVFVFVVCLSANAQEKRAGLRLGWGGGLTYVQSITEREELELILSPRWSGLILTGLYERSFSASTRSWKWFYGGGFHLGYHHRDNFVGEGFNGDPQFINTGFDLIIGTRHRMDALPLELSFDFKPTFELVAMRPLQLEEFAFSCRYFFNPPP